MALKVVVFLLVLSSFASPGICQSTSSSPQPPEEMVEVGDGLGIFCYKDYCTMLQRPHLIDKWNAMKSYPSFFDNIAKIIKLKMPDNIVGDDFTATEILGLALNDFKDDDILKEEFDSLLRTKTALIKKRGQYHKVHLLFRCRNDHFPESVQNCTNAVNRAYDRCVNAKGLSGQALGFCSVSNILEQCHDVEEAAQEHCQNNPLPIVEAIVKDFCGKRQMDQQECSGRADEEKPECPFNVTIDLDVHNLGQYQYQLFFEEPEPNLCEILSDMVSGSTGYICPFLNNARSCVGKYIEEEDGCTNDGVELRKQYKRICDIPQFRAEHPTGEMPKSSAMELKPWSMLMGLALLHYFLFA